MNWPSRVTESQNLPEEHSFRSQLSFLIYKMDLTCPHGTHQRLLFCGSEHRSCARKECTGSVSRSPRGVNAHCHLGLPGSPMETFLVRKANSKKANWTLRGSIVILVSVMTLQRQSLAVTGPFCKWAMMFGRAPTGDPGAACVPTHTWENTICPCWMA